MAVNPAKRRKLDGEASLDQAISVAVRQPTTFVLETDELLKESRLDYEKSFEGVDDSLRRIKTSIESIEPHEPVPIADAAKKLKKAHKIRVPFPEPAPPKDSNYKLSYAKPEQFNVVGSYVSKTMVKTQEDRTVDMIIVLPREVLQEKDYLNMRYYYKRAYYAAQIAAALQKEFEGTANFAFECLNDNPLLPVVAVTTKKMSTKKSKRINEEDPTANAQPQAEFKIRVIPCAPDGYFPKQKITAAAGLIRSGGDEDKKTVHPPTPFYNSTLKAEASFVSYLRVLKQAEKTCASFKDACMLGRIWLQQRGFGGSVSRGGFGHFEWSVLMALLLQTGGRKDTAALSPSLNSTQLFKATIQYLAAMDFSKKPFILGQAKEAPDAIRESGPVVYDAIRQLNIAFKMSASSADMLHQYAKWTHSLLNEKSADQFTPTFITKVDQPSLMYDLNASLELPEAFDDSSHDSRGKLASFCNKVHSVLKRALGNRAQLVSVGTVALPSWSITEHPAKPVESRVSIHVIFDPVNASRQVDHGPPAEEKKEAEKFQRFWGEKSELRRFKDGSILETLIWSSTTPADLCEEIMRYILPLHLKITANSVGLTFYGRGFSSLVTSSQSDTAAFSAARAAFEAFEQDVRGLEDIPLHVRQIAPICAELRNATVNPPTFGSAKSAPRPMDVVIFFEASGKWPENIAAIQRAKIAFLLKIGSLLEEAKRDVTTHLGLEDAQSELENLAFLDVIYESGAAFRLRIHSDLEEVLLDRRTKDKSLDQHIRTESATLLANFRRLYTHLPLHTTMFKTYTTRFPALSPTIRLLKRWFDAHKLTSHFPPDLLELFALHVFLQPHPWPQPSSATTGFLRTLLFLSRWDWRSEPLTIDTSSQSNPTPDTDNQLSTPLDPAAASTRLQAWRNLDPAMNRVVLLAVTQSDPAGTAHTTLAGHPAPGKVVAARMTALARSAIRVVREKGVEIGAPDAGKQLLFVPALADFDMRIVLDRKALKAASRVWEGEDPEADADEGVVARKFKNLDARTGAMPLPVGVHPAALLVEQLSRVYSGPLVFFRGAEDDVVIGGVWNPLVQRRSFRVNLLGSYKPVAADGDSEMKDGGESEGSDGEDDVVEVNREGIIAEIARIGGDLIERIEVKGQ
ncbi:Nrap protein [Coniochaeta ligniaria NRRL 30616]|uniref:U3 small nucleolar RNA-associated protein 22 n=1 Tax=Coniochaeta ligniaria NRRL 30616 TaxID=1408157 RepID=A0A1J7IGA7_9PEZI|nr:Nrap protein [Coniochaeta ligniaria NRRL 30616]